MTTLPPLTLNHAEMREVGQQVMDVIIDHFHNLNETTVVKNAFQPDLAHYVREAMPHKGTAPKELVESIRRDVLENAAHLDHPRNFAFVPSPSNFMSVMADALVSAYNIFAGGTLGPSVIADIEVTTINWILEMLGFSVKDAGGLFVSGGSMANLTALAVARHVKLKDITTNAAIYFSDQTHSSVEKDLKLLGFQTYQIRKIPSDDNYRLSMDALKAKIDDDRRRGLLPFCVVANAGTTNAGVVDPLLELVPFCKEEGLWLHVDAAYGGGAVLSKKGKAAFAGINQADSVTVDPHKWFYQPYEIGCAIIKDYKQLRDTFKVSAEYLDAMQAEENSLNFYDYGIQLTRSFRALKLWLSLKTFGLDAFKEAAEIGMNYAEYIEEQLKKDGDCWEIVSPAQLAIINFRYIKKGLTDAQLDSVNRMVQKRITDEGFALICPTTLSGKLVIRMCVINPRTTQDDIDETLKRLKRYAEEEVQRI